MSGCQKNHDFGSTVNDWLSESHDFGSTINDWLSGPIC